MSSRDTRLPFLFLGRSVLALGVALLALALIAPARAADGDILADSMADWSVTGTQGELGWFNGYYNRSADLAGGGDGIFQAGELTLFLNDGSGVPETCAAAVPCAAAPVEVNHWNGSAYDFEGNPPWTTLAQENAHPNGTNNVAEHWAMRRWESDHDGPVTVEARLRKQAAAGQGTTIILFHNGVELGRVSHNGTGDVVLQTYPTLASGDVLDLALSPEGVDGNPSDGSDSSFFSLRVIEGISDVDTDGVGDPFDNCVDVANADQADDDADGLGDVCDNCPSDANPGQEDPDEDGLGEVCDDDDGDGSFNAFDNCPAASNADQADGDGDGVGDVCDNCPVTANPGQEDRDQDGCGNACDMAIADSVDDWSTTGTQGENSWFNGYYNLTLDGDTSYQAADFIPFDQATHWRGTQWRLVATNAPWLNLQQEGIHPNGTNSAPNEEMWAIRRYVVPGEVFGVTYWQGFEFADGTTDLGDGSVIGSSDGTAQVQGGALRLTDAATTSTRASYRIPALVGSADGFVVEFDVTLSDAAGGNPPADGFSFTYGAIPAPGAGPAGGHGDAEEGFGGATPQLSFEFDTWRNPDPEQGFNVSVNGVDVPGGFLNTIILPDDSTVSARVVLSWDPTNGANLAVDAGGGLTPIFSDLPTPGFTGSDAHSFAFSARTGGATETVLLDNLHIETAAAATASKLVAISWGLRATNPNGGGTAGALFINDTPVDFAKIAGNDVTGVIRTYYAEVGVGDTIDLALTPENLDGTRQDGSDGSATWMRIKMKIPCDSFNESSEIIADSQADWSTTGTQGENGWSYGFYDVRADLTNRDGVYGGAGDFIAFRNDGSGVVSADPAIGGWQNSMNHWDGTKWDLLNNGAPVSHGPWTEVSQAGGHPAANGQTDPSVHWAMRRWTSNVDGLVRVRGVASKTASGDGVVCRIFQNDTEVLTQFVNLGVNYSVELVVATGDTLDFAIDPDGAGVLDPGDLATLDLISDGSDGTTFTATIESVERDNVRPCVAQLSGDCNQDGTRDISDLICEVRVLFGPFFILDQTPQEPPCDTAEGTTAVLDVNGDARFDISDVLYLADSLFRGGPPPVLGLDCILLDEFLGCQDFCVDVQP